MLVTLKQKQEQERDRWQERDLGSAEKNFTGAGILVHNMAVRLVSDLAWDMFREHKTIRIINCL